MASDFFIPEGAVPVTTSDGRKGFMIGAIDQTSSAEASSTSEANSVGSNSDSLRVLLFTVLSTVGAVLMSYALLFLYLRVSKGSAGFAFEMTETVVSDILNLFSHDGSTYILAEHRVVYAILLCMPCLLATQSYFRAVLFEGEGTIGFMRSVVLWLITPLVLTLFAGGVSTFFEWLLPDITLLRYIGLIPLALYYAMPFLYCILSAMALLGLVSSRVQAAAK